MEELTDKQKELWEKIRRTLWEKWDPIGLYEEDSEFDDEYDNYVPHIFRLAIENHDYLRIATSLTSTSNQIIGLSVSDNNERDLKVARIIVQAKKEILGE